MSWLKDVLTTPIPDLFKKISEEAPKTPEAERGAPAAKTPAKAPEAPKLPKELDTPEAKGIMAMFYRKWKDPSFLKKLRVLAAHMAKDGVDLKNQSQVKDWLEKHKNELESGKYNEAPANGASQETYVKTGPDVGRNDPCTCGSGKKYKKCCGAAAPRA